MDHSLISSLENLFCLNVTHTLNEFWKHYHRATIIPINQLSIWTLFCSNSIKYSILVPNKAVFVHFIFFYFPLFIHCCIELLDCVFVYSTPLVNVKIKSYESIQFYIVRHFHSHFLNCIYKSSLFDFVYSLENDKLAKFKCMLTISEYLSGVWW